jgi:CRP-like cAMP-binding protein
MITEMLALLFRNEESVPKHCFHIFEQKFMYMDGEYFYKASEINKGAAFGELALLNKDSKRMAAIICESEVVFATLDRANFNECRQKVIERQELKLFNFLTDIPFFQSIQKHKIQRITAQLKKFTYTRGQAVYFQGQQVKFVCIVIKGDFELTKKLQKPTKRQTRLTPCSTY